MSAPQDRRHTLRVTARQAAFINHLAITHLNKLREGRISARHDTQPHEDEMCVSLHAKTWVLYEEHIKEKHADPITGEALLISKGFTPRIAKRL